MDNIRMEIKEMRWEIVDWIHVTQYGALVDTVINLRVP
jgi:hypothetical protein